jgi:L-amino acid N-acyltransferase YncA
LAIVVDRPALTTHSTKRPGKPGRFFALGGGARYALCGIMSKLVIRPTAAGDIPAITAIYGHAVQYGTASFEIDPPNEREMANRFRGLADAGFPCLVAELDRAVRGYAYAGPYRTRVAYRYTLEDSIYIAPEFHGRGIGRALINRLLTEATAQGFRQMIAVIGDSAQVASIALHRAAGFRMVGTFEAVGFKFDRWLDSVLMQRHLGPGAGTTP